MLNYICIKSKIIKETRCICERCLDENMYCEICGKEIKSNDKIYCISEDSLKVMSDIGDPSCPPTGMHVHIKCQYKSKPKISFNHGGGHNDPVFAMGYGILDLKSNEKNIKHTKVNWPGLSID